MCDRNREPGTPDTRSTEHSSVAVWSDDGNGFVDAFVIVHAGNEPL